MTTPAASASGADAMLTEAQVLHERAWAEEYGLKLRIKICDAALQSLRTRPDADEPDFIAEFATHAAGHKAYDIGITPKQINELVRYIDALRTLPAQAGGEDALRQIKAALVAANEMENGPICDTIWMPSGTETLFDYIDSLIDAAPTDAAEAGRAAERKGMEKAAEIIWDEFEKNHVINRRQRDHLVGRFNEEARRASDVTPNSHHRDTTS